MIKSLNGIFDIVEMAGLFFILFGSLYVMYEWYGIIGFVSLLVYLLIMLIIMGITIEAKHDKRLSKDTYQDNFNNDSWYKKSTLNTLAYDEEGLKWMTVVYEVPLTALIIIYTYHSVESGMLYISLYLFVSISWTKLRLGHSVFDRIAAHKVLSNDISDLQWKSENQREKGDTD